MDPVNLEAMMPRTWGLEPMLETYEVGAVPIRGYAAQYLTLTAILMVLDALAFCFYFDGKVPIAAPIVWSCFASIPLFAFVAHVIVNRSRNRHAKMKRKSPGPL
jgi:hypothetical protein